MDKIKYQKFIGQKIKEGYKLKYEWNNKNICNCFWLRPFLDVNLIKENVKYNFSMNKNTEKFIIVKKFENGIKEKSFILLF